jgi:putative intracellular protease/amidase
MAYGISGGIAPEGVALVKEAFNRGLPIAAQQGGVVFLANAEILKGKHFAIGADTAYAVRDGIYSGSGVVQDGNIGTAGVCPFREDASTPSTTTDLTAKFIELLKSTK